MNTAEPTLTRGNCHLSKERSVKYLWESLVRKILHCSCEQKFPVETHLKSPSTTDCNVFELGLQNWFSLSCINENGTISISPPSLFFLPLINFECEMGSCYARWDDSLFPTGTVLWHFLPLSHPSSDWLMHPSSGSRQNRHTDLDTPGDTSASTQGRWQPQHQTLNTESHSNKASF